MLIGEIQKNALEKIMVSTENYKGYDFIDVRVYYQDKDEEWKPTRKGIAIPPDRVEDLVKLIKKAHQGLSQKQQTEKAPSE